MRPNQIDPNFDFIWIVTAAAELVPVKPAGRHAMTTLCSPMRPRVYKLVSLAL